jgi:hypothetical protein
MRLACLVVALALGTSGCVGGVGGNVGVHFIPGVGARLQAETDLSMALGLGEAPRRPDVLVRYGVTPGVFYDLHRGEFGGMVRLEISPHFLLGDAMVGGGAQFGFDSQQRFPQLGLFGQVDRAFVVGSICPAYHLLGLRPSLAKHIDLFGQTRAPSESALGPWDLGLMATYRYNKQFLSGSGFC